jgi:hypothetical protein
MPLAVRKISRNNRSIALVLTFQASVWDNRGRWVRKVLALRSRGPMTPTSSSLVAMQHLPRSKELCHLPRPSRGLLLIAKGLIKTVANNNLVVPVSAWVLVMQIETDV